MLDSDFWRDLGDRFQAVDSGELLRADWQHTVKAGDEGKAELRKWRIVATRLMRSVVLEFEVLARRGGPKIYPNMDSRDAWLETLLGYQLNAQAGPAGIETRPDGTVVAHIYTGTIAPLRQASVDLCRIMESSALEQERMATASEERKNHQSQRPTPATVRTARVTGASEVFPNRASWLRDRLRERGWNHNDPHRYNGPDRKTVLKILRGEGVREDVLEKLAKALSQKSSIIELLEIPRT